MFLLLLFSTSLSCCSFSCGVLLLLFVVCCVVVVVPYIIVRGDPQLAYISYHTVSPGTAPRASLLPPRQNTLNSCEICVA